MEAPDVWRKIKNDEFMTNINENEAQLKAKQEEEAMRKGVNAPKSAQDPTSKLLDDMAKTQQYEANDRMR